MDTTFSVDTITIDVAGEIDANWMNAGMPDDGLRLVHTKRHTLLTVPSLNGAAPLYQFSRHNPTTGEYGQAYYHVTGPTLADWQERQRFNAVDLRNEQTYRDLAADSASRGFSVNAECFTAKADFYGQRAASR